jgi:hypothetical protein
MANKRLLPLGALLPFLAICAFAQTATTDPVGFTKFTIPKGRTALGVNLVNTSLITAAVTGNNSTSITLAGVTNAGSLLSTDDAYYIEVVGGTDTIYIGDRVDVDVTATKAAANNTVALTTTGEGNTLGTIASNSLSGYRVALRKHVTIGQVFGTKGATPMQGGTTSTAADQIIFYKGNSMETYFLLRSPNGAVEQWVMVNGGSASKDKTIIYPGSGMFVNRVGNTTVEITFTGEVRTNSLARPLTAGYNLVANGFPVDQTPASRLMTYSNGFAGGTTSTAADRILTLQTNGSTDTYFLLRSPNGSVEQWTKVNGGSSSQNNVTLFKWDGAALIYKIKADPNHVIPVTF